MVEFMIRVKNIKLRYGESKNSILEKACKKLKIKTESVIEYNIFKESLDVRKKEDIFYIYTVDLKVKNENSVIKHIKNPDIQKAEYTKYEYPKLEKEPKDRPIIVGFGPAGMFAGLILSQMGLKPIIFERGKNADDRLNDIQCLMDNGILDKNSNIQFGEGGAGTFSDGKLTTRIKNPRCRKVMEEFVKHGAPEEIMYVHNPHIGTDKLVDVVKNIRKDIINLGGEIYFNSTVTGLNIKNGEIEGVVVNNKQSFKSSNVIIALGHSARDTFEMLYNSNIKMEQKPFAIGARIEHSQEMINKAQYGDSKKAEFFGPAEYKLTYTASNGRGVYTFCMCPGGYVVPAASEEEMTAVNGMSYYSRNGKNSNSALLVQINTDDFNTNHPLGGLYFQRDIEKKAYKLSGGGYKAPAQRVGDFLGVDYSKDNNVETTYKPGVTFCNLSEIFPHYVTEAMKEAIPAMGRKIKGFDTGGAILVAPESRSSSPVRILRDLKSGESLSVKGLFPSGEGAGYAGGIMSAAVDGIFSAEMVINRINKM